MITRLAWFAALLPLAYSPTFSIAQTGPWLTLIGEPNNQNSELVEADADSIVHDGTKRSFYIRVNRASQRTARDGFGFRSYVSRVEVNCADRTARHVAQSLYAQPLWFGEMRQYDYALRDVRPLAFRDMQSAPREVIVQSACKVGATH